MHYRASNDWRGARGHFETKKTNSLFENQLAKFPATPLYLGDIERLIRVGTDRGLSVTISDSTDEYENLDDLIENRGKRVKNLSLAFAGESKYNAINLEIGESKISLRAPKDDKLLPAWHEMKSLIENRAPVQARYMKPTLWFFVEMGMLGVLSQSNWPPSGSLIRIAMLLFPFVMGFYSAYYIRISGGVYLQRQHEVEGFWDRNADKIYLLVIGAVLGAVGQFIVQKITPK